MEFGGCGSAGEGPSVVGEETRPLEVKEDGGIMAGNTRVSILQERGIDVNSLPLIDYVPWKMTELLEPPVP
jgi:hypothetical protein